MSMLLMPTELRDAIVTYLATKPYGEVAEGIAMLRALQPAPVAPPVRKEPPVDAPPMEPPPSAD